MAKKSKKNTSKKKKPAKKAAKKVKKKTAKRPARKKKPQKKKIATAKAKKTAKKPKTAKKVAKPVKAIAPKKVEVKQKPAPIIPAKPEIKVVKPVKEVQKKPEPAEIKPPPPPKKVIRTTFSSSSLKDEKKKTPHPNQYSFEYVMHGSPGLLFEMISTPSGLSEWFANDVNIRDGNFTFMWDGSQQVAKLIAYKKLKFVRFHWLDKPDYTYFEFRIEVDELTNEASVIVTDFAEDGDKESARMLWDNEIGKLKKAIGS